MPPVPPGARAPGPGGAGRGGRNLEPGPRFPPAGPERCTALARTAADGLLSLWRRGGSGGCSGPGVLSKTRARARPRARRGRGRVLRSRSLVAFLEKLGETRDFAVRGVGAQSRAAEPRTPAPCRRSRRQVCAAQPRVPAAPTGEAAGEDRFQPRQCAAGRWLRNYLGLMLVSEAVPGLPRPVCRDPRPPAGAQLVWQADSANGQGTRGADAVVRVRHEAPEVIASGDKCMRSAVVMGPGRHRHEAPGGDQPTWRPQRRPGDAPDPVCPREGLPLMRMKNCHQQIQKY